jgi:dTDP-glucose 4,6-dehydratase/UDP-glucose 4-epimerase
MKKTSILILGSNGFIGSHLVNHFLYSGLTVSGCDLTDSINPAIAFYKLNKQSSALENIFNVQRFDYCINAAGNGNLNLSISDPEFDFNANTQFTFQILEKLRVYAPECKYLHISSAAVYGNPQSLPVAENSIINPISPYGWHKYLSELLCKEYYSLYGIRSAIIRPFSVYGLGLKKQIFWDVFEKIKSNQYEIELWGTGEETRDFIYIDDLCAAIHLIINNSSMSGDIFNVSSGNMTTIADAVHLLLNKMNTSVKVRFNGKVRAGNPNKWQADIKKINALGFIPSVNFEQGISKVADWFMKQ